jgi:hypothetical protein
VLRGRIRAVLECNEHRTRHIEVDALRVGQRWRNPEDTETGARRGLAAKPAVPCTSLRMANPSTAPQIVRCTTFRKSPPSRLSHVHTAQVRSTRLSLPACQTRRTTACGGCAIGASAALTALNPSPPSLSRLIRGGRIQLAMM